MPAFLAPLFLAGIAAAAVPIVLHLLKREPEARVKFAAVRLLKRAPVEHTQRRYLRELLLLCLRVATLVLLALAFARPFFPMGLVASGGTTVVVLDTSYSLDAPGRFERAKDLAKQAIARAPAGDLIGVVTFADAAQIVAKPAGDRVLASSSIDDAAVGYGGTRYRTALSAATQALGGRAGRIVVVTDLQESGWDAGDRASVPVGATIEIVDVGAAPPNAAVTSVRPLPDRVVATIHNTAPVARDIRVHLRVDDREAGDVTVSIAANQSADVPFPGAPRGTAVAVSIDDPSGIQADNVRYAVPGGRSQASILVITGSGDLSKDGFYVQQALMAGGSRAYKVLSTTGGQLAAGDVLTPHAAVLILSTRGLERRGREALAAYARSGGGILVAAGPDVDGDVVSDVLGADSTLRVAAAANPQASARTLAPADVRHPVFQSFAGDSATLGLVTFQRASQIGGASCVTLARFTTGDTALVECPVGDGRALVFASDLDNRWNDFPVHATFVPFLHESVRYLASARAHASDYFVGDAPSGTRPVPGVVTLRDARAGAPSRQIAINVDPRESDPARISVDEFEATVTRMAETAASAARVEARQQEDAQHLWQYALGLMVLMLCVEGLVAARTA